MVLGVSEDGIYIGTDLEFEEAYEEIARYNKSLYEWGHPENFYVEIDGGSYEINHLEDFEKFLEMADSNDDDILFMICDLIGTEQEAEFFKGKEEFEGSGENRVVISGVEGYKNGLLHPDHLEGELEELYQNLSQ